MEISGAAEPPVKAKATGANEGVPDYGIREDYPMLWKTVQDFDFAERLGGSNSMLDKEIDAAMRELWVARGAIEVLKQKAKMARSISASPDYDEEGIVSALWALVDAVLPPERSVVQTQSDTKEGTNHDG